MAYTYLYVCTFIDSQMYIKKKTHIILYMYIYTYIRIHILLLVTRES